MRTRPSQLAVSSSTWSQDADPEPPPREQHHLVENADGAAHRRRERSPSTRSTASPPVFGTRQTLRERS